MLTRGGQRRAGPPGEGAEPTRRGADSGRSCCGRRWGPSVPHHPPPCRPRATCLGDPIAPQDPRVRGTATLGAASAAAAWPPGPAHLPASEPGVPGGGGGCPAFPRPCARPRGQRWGLRMALLPGLWDPGPLSCTVRGNTRPGPGDLGFPVTSWKYTSRRGFWGVCRCPRERPCVTTATRAETLRGTKPQTSPRAGPGGASCPGPVLRRRVPSAKDLRDPVDARSLCPQALSLCAMRSPPCLAGLCPRCRARQTGRPRTLGVLSPKTAGPPVLSGGGGPADRAACAGLKAGRGGALRQCAGCTPWRRRGS